MKRKYNDSHFKIIKPADILLGLFIVIISLFLTFFIVKNDDLGKQAVVYLNNEVYGIYNLTDDQKIEIKNNNNYNLLEIKDGNISMIDASCHNHICIKEGPINTTNDTIVCLPNKIFVTIVADDLNSDNNNSIDSISQ